MKQADETEEIRNKFMIMIAALGFLADVLIKLFVYMSEKPECVQYCFPLSKKKNRTYFAFLVHTSNFKVCKAH